MQPNLMLLAIIIRLIPHPCIPRLIRIQRAEATPCAPSARTIRSKRLLVCASRRARAARPEAPEFVGHPADQPAGAWLGRVGGARGEGVVGGECRGGEAEASGAEVDEYYPDDGGDEDYGEEGEEEGAEGGEGHCEVLWVVRWWVVFVGARVVAEVGSGPLAGRVSELADQPRDVTVDDR
ncbi:hypothetical protein V502_10326 [Pseudogymnoascus sp. VKM F-4520 (FW-2644)]|nr:hypothetical protein V502_10326 [Pseudogymnoascus sp. VKM F-4520 (FW-2644)]